jgi:hypothetical protein
MKIRWEEIDTINRLDYIYKVFNLEINMPFAGKDPSRLLSLRIRVLRDVIALNDCMMLMLSLLNPRSNVSSLFHLDKLSKPMIRL